ncbi:hypothetical protein CQW39_10505 [Streptomyces griseofuscus]|uniref:Uncharacterized protein n=1 Tax=Streptomyces griseofuscus TaxID=146922 RepID=A0A3R8RBW7_9ACTN|nr:DUF6412 domain-containing protein [Streptomyces griseofuscus]RRQ79543.1 hypothetical protein CQW39_10505 [Streptomyces griseofuscus]RRQ85014.1 hypothetical protein CQW44_18625 [Streptomyces griseofuscus]
MSGTMGRGPGRAVAFLLAPLFFLLPLALLDTGGLTTAVALAATAAAGSALALCTLIAAGRAPAVPPTRIRTAIRDRARRTAFLPQRDPDARGRRRPRAPGRALPATAA